LTKQILAAYDDEGIYVYQAFKPSTVATALEKGTFGAGFSMDRMTWIKPSFGWMLHRSGYAMKTRQQSILKIKITHEGFQQALRWAVLTTWNRNFYPTEDEWRSALKKSPVRVQWDPDRTLSDHKTEHRAIQIGLRGKSVHAYVNEWIIGLEEVTALAHQIGELKQQRKPIEVTVPDERVYPVDDEIMQRLGM
jgi:hypothetical protein